MKKKNNQTQKPIKLIDFFFTISPSPLVSQSWVDYSDQLNVE